MQEHSIEQGFDLLEQITNQMENNDIGLEESFELYKKGMEEIAYINSKIEETEKKVLELQNDGSLKVFDDASVDAE